MAGRALVEVNAGIGGHRLELSMTAEWTGNGGVENHEPRRKVGICLTDRA